MVLPYRIGLLAVTLGAALSGCAGAPAPVAGEHAPPRRYSPPPAALRRAPPPARLQSLPGMEGVIGATAEELTRQFGPARLDSPEGDARKLQFTGAACVLDVYLYPLVPGRAPQATYADARRSDGRDVDRAACVVALRRR